MSNLLMERDQFEIGIAAVADFAAGDVASDVVNMKNYDSVRFITHWGVGATGVVQLTVDACDDVVPTNTAKVPFWYRVKVGSAAPGAPTLEQVKLVKYDRPWATENKDRLIKKWQSAVGI